MLIPRSALAVRAIAAREDSRYAMSGVAVSRRAFGRAELAATDGRRAIVVSWADEGDMDGASYPVVNGVSPDVQVTGFSTILPVAALAQAERDIPRNGPRPELRCLALDERAEPGQPVSVAATDLVSPVVRRLQPLDGRMPDIDAVRPGSGKPDAEFHVAAESLAELLTAMAKAAPERAEKGMPLCVRIRCFGDAVPLELTASTGGIDIYALQMPMSVPRETE